MSYLYLNGVMNMVQVLGTGVEAEQQQVYEEGRSVLGSLLTRLIAIVHMIVDHVVRIARQVLAYAGEHPLALSLMVCNLCIWMS